MSSRKKLLFGLKFVVVVVNSPKQTNKKLIQMSRLFKNARHKNNKKRDKQREIETEKKQ